MKLEPVARFINFDGRRELVWLDKELPTQSDLYAIPPGYKLVPVEPTDEWIANMRKGTIEPQGMDAQAKIIENLRRNYKRWLAAIEGEQ